MFLSTVCEPSAVNETRHTTLWGRRSGEWRELLRFAKDRWPMKLMQYGQLLFPTGPGDEHHLWFTPFATVEDQTSLKVPLDQLFA